MKTYSKGDKLIIDYHSSKPRATCVEVVTDGSGSSIRGEIRALITTKKDIWHGRIVLVDTRHAVPVGHMFTRGDKLMVRTDYEWKQEAT